MLNEHEMDRIAREIMQSYKDSPTDIDAEVKRLTKQKREIEEDIQTLIEMRLKREITPALLTKTSAEKEEELATVNRRLFAMTEQQRHAVTHESIMQYLRQLLEYSNSDNADVLKLLFDNLVEKIIISDESVDIYLRVYARADFAYKNSSGHPLASLYSSVNV